MARRIFGLFIILCFFFHTCTAQKYLGLDKGGKVKRVRFYTGDIIKLKIDGQKKWIGGKIGHVGDSIVRIGDTLITIKKIKAIRYRVSGSGIGLLKQASVMLPAAGGALLAISAINAGINNTTPVYSPGLLIVAGGLIACGPVTYAVLFRQYRVNKRHELKVLDASVN